MGMAADAFAKEQTAQDVISRLKFISTIKPGEKIDVASLSVQADTVLGRLYRTVLARGESRAATLEFVRLTLGEAFDLAQTQAAHKDAYVRRLGAMVFAAIVAAKAGILGLSETYKDDRMFVSRIETLLGSLDAKIAEVATVGGG